MSFTIESNSYFNGADLYYMRNDGKSVKLNVYDGYWSVCVKDHDNYWTLPDDVAAIAAELEPSDNTGFAPSHGVVDRLYERAREDYWYWVNDFLAPEYGYGDIYQAGRSGGWLSVEALRADHFDIDLNSVRPIGPLDEEEQREFDERDQFIRFAFDCVEAIDGQRQIFYESIREEKAERDHEAAEVEHWKNRDVMTEV